jgi:hypothetical protein
VLDGGRRRTDNSSGRQWTAVDYSRRRSETAAANAAEGGDLMGG